MPSNYKRDLLGDRVENFPNTLKKVKQAKIPVLPIPSLVPSALSHFTHLEVFFEKVL